MIPTEQPPVHNPQHATDQQTGDPLFVAAHSLHTHPSLVFGIAKGESNVHNNQSFPNDRHQAELRLMVQTEIRVYVRHNTHC